MHCRGRPWARSRWTVGSARPGWQHAAHGLHTGLSQGRDRGEGSSTREGYSLAAWGLRPSLWPATTQPPHAEAPRLNPPCWSPPGGSVPSRPRWHGRCLRGLLALTPQPTSSDHRLRPSWSGDHPRPGPSDHRGAAGGLSWVSGSGPGDTGVGLCTRACVLVGEPGKGSAMEMGEGVCWRAAPGECGGGPGSWTLRRQTITRGWGGQAGDTWADTARERTPAGQRAPAGPKVTGKPAPSSAPPTAFPRGGSVWAPGRDSPGPRGQKVHALPGDTHPPEAVLLARRRGPSHITAAEPDSAAPGHNSTF